LQRLPGRFLFVFAESLPEQGPNRAGFAFRLLQQFEKLGISVAVYF
jgi:hypothetical protein